MKTVYLFLATGFEEIEALTIVDMLLPSRNRYYNRFHIAKSSS